MFRLPTIDDLSFVLDAAMQVDDPVAGAIQLAEGHGKRLRAIETRGFSEARAARARNELMSSAGGRSYQQALLERRRIVIRDVESDPGFAPHRDSAALAGYRSVQSTPLLDSEFRALGVLSTYFDRPHHPEPESLRRIDGYCRIAALVIEVDELHQQIVNADRRLSTPPRALPAPVAEAAASARRLLPTMAQPGHASALHSVANQLEIVARFLRTMMHQTRRSGSFNANRD